MHSPPVWRLIALFFGALFLLLSVFASAFRNTQTLLDQITRVEQTYEVLTALDTLRSHNKEIESSTRGYVLTGDPAYLVPIERSSRDLPAAIERLQHLLMRQASHEDLLLPLRRALEQRVAFSEQVIRLRREQGFDAAYRLKVSGQGLALSHTIQKRLEAFKATERTLLNEWLEQEHASATRLLQWMVLSGVLAIGLIVVALVLLLRYMLKQWQAEQALQEAYAQSAELAAFSQALNQQPDLLSCLQTLLDSYAPWFQTSQYAILSAEGETLTLLAHNHPEWETGTQIERHKAPLMAYALDTGQTVHQDQGPGPPPVHPLEGPICVPLRVGSESVGILNLSQVPGGPVTHQQLDRLAQIAAHLASALRRSLLYEQVAEQAQRDELTGCLNRRALFDWLEQELERCRRYGGSFCLLMLDIDHFKTVNDQQGHQVGDAMLKAFAGRIQNQIRQLDRLGRYGGEEFVLLLPGTPGQEALCLAERLRQAITQTPLLDCWPNPLTVSIGVAAWHPEDAADTLLARADQALYAAKAAGRNQVCSAGELT